MNDKVIVSIICTTYNHENFIEKALESFLFQKTNFRYEILVHEDASTDKTAEIVRKYEEKYPELFKVIYQKENQYSKGKCPSKYLWNIAQGRYFALCEGDDYWIDKYKLQKQVNFLEKNKEYIGSCHNNYVVNYKEEIVENKGEYYQIVEEHDILEKKDLGYNGGLCGHTSTLVFRNFWKDLTEEKKYKWYNLKGPGDQILNRYLLTLGKMKYFEDIMSCYRQTFNTSSWSSQRSGKNNSYQRCLEEEERVNFFYEECNDEKKYNFSGCLLEAFNHLIKRPNKKNKELFMQTLAFINKREKNKFKLWYEFFKKFISNILIKLKLKNLKGIKSKWKKIKINYY